MGGENQFHAIFGGGPSFVVDPSDTAPALVALEATFRVIGPSGERTVPAAEFFSLPRVDAKRENVLGKTKSWRPYPCRLRSRIRAAPTTRFSTARSEPMPWRAPQSFSRSMARPRRAHVLGGVAPIRLGWREWRRCWPASGSRRNWLPALAKPLSKVRTLWPKTPIRRL